MLCISFCIFSSVYAQAEHGSPCVNSVSQRVVARLEVTFPRLEDERKRKYGENQVCSLAAPRGVSGVSALCAYQRKAIKIEKRRE